MATRILAWHFLAEDRRLRFGEREVVEVGKTYTAEGPLVMCANGMHGSRRVLDALHFAPGPIVCRVALMGKRIDDADKSVARSRHVLWMLDATDLLHECACLCAEDALRLIPKPDPRSIEAIRVKRAWVAGKATDVQLDAARDAAWVAAGVAAGDAARAAAWDAARDAAWVAAWVAAWDAAWVAAGDAAWDAARTKQNRRLTGMVLAEKRKQSKSPAAASRTP